jgi:hypothetical protein
MNEYAFGPLAVGTALRLTRVTIFLLVDAVKLQQLRVVVAEAWRRLCELLGDGAAQAATRF